MVPQFIPDLIDIEQELFELPQKVCESFLLYFSTGDIFSDPTCFQERVLYNKEIQTTSVENDTQTTDEDEMQERVLRERERELDVERAARERELEYESVQLDQEIEAVIRGAPRSSIVIYQLI
jgi:dynein intermediate chain